MIYNLRAIVETTVIAGQRLLQVSVYSHTIQLRLSK